MDRLLVTHAHAVVSIERRKILRVPLDVVRDVEFQLLRIPFFRHIVESWKSERVDGQELLLQLRYLDGSNFPSIFEVEDVRLVESEHLLGVKRLLDYRLRSGPEMEKRYRISAREPYSPTCRGPFSDGRIDR